MNPSRPMRCRYCSAIGLGSPRETPAPVGRCRTEDSSGFLLTSGTRRSELYTCHQSRGDPAGFTAAGPFSRATASASAIPALPRINEPARAGRGWPDHSVGAAAKLSGHKLTKCKGCRERRPRAPDRRGRTGGCRSAATGRGLLEGSLNFRRCRALGQAAAPGDCPAATLCRFCRAPSTCLSRIRVDRIRHLRWRQKRHTRTSCSRLTE